MDDATEELLRLKQRKARMGMGQPGPMRSSSSTNEDVEPGPAETDDWEREPIELIPPRKVDLDRDVWGRLKNTPGLPPRAPKE